jgi:DNA-binding NtrC family response regulator
MCPGCEHEWHEVRPISLPLELKKAERDFGNLLIEIALAQAKGNVTEAAAQLRMERTTLLARIRRWGFWHEKAQYSR